MSDTYTDEERLNMATSNKAKKPAPVEDDEDDAPVAAKKSAPAKKGKKDKVELKIRGSFVYPRINEPDTKFKDAGEYSVKVAKPAAESKRLIADLEKLYAEGYKELCAREGKSKLKMATTRPWTNEVDRETEEETGRILFNCKAAASGKSKKTGKMWKFTLPVVDSKIKPVTKNVWGGSEGYVLVEPYVWYTAALGCGISLRLNSVQVLELVTGKGADLSGFSEEEGYEEDSDGGSSKGDDSDDDEDSDSADY